ncbi:MAG: hypothetical protein V4719_02515 [Planctomycetota bacterium]
MSIDATNTGAIPSNILADGEALLEAVMAGRKPDPELARRVRERAGKITEDIRQKHGVLNIGTKLIREFRDQ